MHSVASNAVDADGVVTTGNGPFVNMQYGLVLPNFGVYSDARLLADLARLAEDAGWHAFFLTDTVQMRGYEESPVADPWIALAAIAMRTERIRIGLRVAAPTRRRPWQLAREAVTLDHLSGGRLTLGVGLGDENDLGFAAVGEEMDMRTRAAILDETLEILQGLWSGQPFSFSGEHYQIDEITLLPPPVQSPRIPIWVGWVWPGKKPLERAARWDGATPFAMRAGGVYDSLTTAELQQLKREMDARRDPDVPFDIVADGPLLDARHSADALMTLRDAAATGATWTLEFIEPEHDIDALKTAIQHGPPSLPERT